MKRFDSKALYFALDQNGIPRENRRWLKW